MQIQRSLKFIGPLVAALTFAGNAIASDHGALDGIESELKHIGHAVNSDALKAARHFCAITAHKAYVEKVIEHAHFLEAQSECAKGNFSKVFHGLGGELINDAHVASTEISAGVHRHLSNWEHNAILMWHKVRPPVVYKEK